MRVHAALVWLALCSVLTACPAQQHSAPPPVAAPPAAKPATSSAATPPTPPTPAAPPVTAAPVAAEPPATASSKLHELPEELEVEDYRGEGLLVDIVAETATPRAGRGDPAELEFALVLQRAKGDYDIRRWKSLFNKPQTFKTAVGDWRLEVTPRSKPQKLATMLSNGKQPLGHSGWYDLLISDAKGRPLGRIAVTGMGWPSLATRDKQPAGLIARTIREGTADYTFFDFKALEGGQALLHLEFREAGLREMSIESKDGETHQFEYPHAALRWLGPGQFKTSREKRSEEKYGRDSG